MAEQERIVLLLGAGASKAFNFPLTKEILPTILGKLEGETLFGSDQAAVRYRKELKVFLERVMPGIWQVTGDILITELLSLMDHMILTSTVPFPEADVGTMTSLRMLLERAIFEALEWPHDPGDMKTVPDGLNDLADWIYEVGRGSHCAIVSTNYDECLETEVYRRVGKHPQVNSMVDFGLSWRDCPSGDIFHSRPDARYGVFKLHGSVNWLKCELCNWITCNDEYIYQTVSYSAISYLKRSPRTTCACGHWPLRSVMVAPSTVRDIRDTNLLSVWKAAFEALRSADRWYIIGYSLPTEDVAIRSMLIRAYNGRKVRPKVEVVQYGDDKQTRSRYTLYFPSCDYRTDGIQGLVERIRRRAL